MSPFATALLLLANGDWDWDHMGGWWILMGIGMFLFWVLVIVGIVVVVRELIRSRDMRRDEPGSPAAMAVLDRRLAEGEITSEEYRERRAVLRGERDPSSGPGST